eukprot:jgi/Tetstr1/458049/TSEL_044557.t1
MCTNNGVKRGALCAALLVLLLRPQGAACQEAESNKEEASGETSWWEACRRAQSLSADVLGRVTALRSDRHDTLGAKRAERLQGWLSTLGMARGIPRLAMSMAWSYLTGGPQQRDLSWLFSPDTQWLLTSMADAYATGTLPAWYSSNSRRIQRAALRLWGRISELGAGAMAEVKEELAQEVQDPHFVPDLAAALYRQCIAQPCDELEGLLQHLQAWGRQQAGGARSRPRRPPASGDEL